MNKAQGISIIESLIALFLFATILIGGVFIADKTLVVSQKSILFIQDLVFHEQAEI